MPKPESIENRWGILNRDFPEVYEAFSSTPYHPTIFEELPKILNLRGKVIADVGAGAGSSTIKLAPFARYAVGGVCGHPTRLVRRRPVRRDRGL